MTTKTTRVGVDQEEHAALDEFGDGGEPLEEAGEEASQDDRSAPFTEEEEEAM